MQATGEGWIEVGCAMCGGTRASTRFTQGAFRIRDCDSCGLTYVTPRRTEDALVDQVYDASYWRSPAAREQGYSDYRGDAELYRRSFRRRWHRLAPRFPARGDGRPLRALDVGCAAGYFLDVLRDEGWEVLGVEPSATIAEAARARHGDGAIHVGTLASLPPTEAFDLVTLWDVLEHLPRPVEALRSARARLAPGGTLIVETQNVESTSARLLGRRWHHYKHGEHLVHFNPRTLRRAFAEAGLNVVEMSPKGAGKFVSGEFIVERSARLWSGLPRLLAPLRRRAATYVNLGDELIAISEPRP